MPATATDARDYLAAKVPTPSEMRSAEWALAGPWLRERAFYMAGVAQAEILEEFREEFLAVAAGERGEEEAFRRLRMALDRLGYQPEPGQKDTIKDLRALRRMQVALRTNIELARGWAQREKGLRTITATPAWEFLRVMPAAVPRDWEARWQLVGGHTTPDGRMIERKDSVVWEDIGSRENFADALDVDHPPFAWGSGMGWRGVGFREAKALGLLDGWTPPPLPPVRSPNESLQTKPRVTEPALRKALAEKMGALAEWHGDTFVFTDPNGTRPLPAEKLAEIWARPMPQPFRTLRGDGLMQKDALAAWFSDHELFRDAGGTDRWQDLLRVEYRLTNTSRPARLWRGISMGNAQLDKFLREIQQAGGYAPRAAFPLESWTASQASASRYAATGGHGWRVILDVRAPRLAKDVTALARALDPAITKRSTPPVATEAEWIYRTGRKFKVLKIERDPETRTVRISLEEAA